MKLIVNKYRTKNSLKISPGNTITFNGNIDILTRNNTENDVYVRLAK